MAVWLNRAGGSGEFESKFIQDSRIYVTSSGLDVNLSKLSDRSELIEVLGRNYPESKPRTLLNWACQIWPFAHEIKPGDLVVLPLKSQRAIQIGEITGKYVFESEAVDPFFHWRTVKWIAEAIPRSHFGKDLLHSFGAFMTICRIERNRAEDRLRAMRANGWRPEVPASVMRVASAATAQVSDESEDTDLEELARDRISRLIEAKFKGHGLALLVEAILRAQGYVTYRSPEGADGGADILAGAGPLGFGVPRLCVEVKSGGGPIDRPTVDKLLGAVTKFGAQEGLFVSWDGFRGTVQKELAPSFFRVRLWTQKELLEALFAHYDQLDEDLRAELPLKRIWTVAAQEE
ncbi:MAG: restriction endonuclease [Acidobacteria bacterium]|nr:restriction endonuclease [Acidobacteriota bacterium]